MSSPIFSIVIGVEWEKVHDAGALFAAAAKAGVDMKEVTDGMVQWGGEWFLRVETTRRIPKASPKRVEAEKIGKKPPKGRILQLANAYAAILAAFDDRIDSDYSPLDD